MNNKQRIIKSPPKPTQAVIVTNQSNELEEIFLANECPLTIYLNKQEIVTIMTMGLYPDYLITGFLLNQQLIKTADDIISIHVDWSVNSAAIYTQTEQKATIGKRIITTGCGQGTMFEHVIESFNQALEITPHLISTKDIYQLLGQLANQNEVYRQAGGVHSCGICTKDKVIKVIEDVGRHNAIDALAGFIGLEKINEKPMIIYTTGRLTSEMILKAAQMQVPIVLSRSGATAMGIKIAERLGITTIARAKGKRFIILTHPKRVSLN